MPKNWLMLIKGLIVYFSDLQALGDSLAHTSGNNEHQEHELEYKKCITQLLFVLNDLCIFDVHF